MPIIEEYGLGHKGLNLISTQITYLNLNLLHLPLDKLAHARRRLLLVNHWLNQIPDISHLWPVPAPPAEQAFLHLILHLHLSLDNLVQPAGRKGALVQQLNHI